MYIYIHILSFFYIPLVNSVCIQPSACLWLLDFGLLTLSHGRRILCSTGRKIRMAKKTSMPGLSFGVEIRAPVMVSMDECTHQMANRKQLTKMWSHLFPCLALLPEFHRPCFQNQNAGWLPSGKRLHNYGKSPCFMGKSSISMAIFNSKLLVSWLARRGNNADQTCSRHSHHEDATNVFSTTVCCKRSEQCELSKCVMSNTCKYIYIDMYMYIIYVHMYIYIWFISMYIFCQGVMEIADSTIFCYTPWSFDSFFT